MDKQIKVPENFTEAFIYINQRYLFNTENYPIIKTFDNFDAVKNFALSHSLLHMLKNIKHLKNIVCADKDDMTKKSILIHSELDKRTFVKMIINMCAMANIFSGSTSDLTYGSIYSIKSAKQYSISSDDIYDSTETFLTQLASYLEKADHMGNLKLSSREGREVADTFWGLLNLYLILIDKYTPDIWIYVPDYMKSK